MLWVRTEFSLLPWLCVSSRNQLWKGGDAVRFDAREQCRHIADGIGVKFIDLGNVVGFLRAVWEFFVIKNMMSKSMEFLAAHQRTSKLFHASTTLPRNP